MILQQAVKSHRVGLSQVSDLAELKNQGNPGPPSGPDLSLTLQAEQEAFKILDKTILYSVYYDCLNNITKEVTLFLI